MAKRHVHFIGIAGVTMAPLAVLYKKMGWKVTGSDRAFFPPMSTYLEEQGIRIMPGFKEEHLRPRPDLVLVMAFITKKNPELAYAIRNRISYKTYGEVLPELIEGKDSVVVAGSRGKTTVSALAAWLLETAGRNPNFMIGGIPKNFSDGIRRTSSPWSVIEGDEYPIANWKKQPKFLAYHPRYLVLTGVQWDHVDIFPTKEAYIASFKKLARRVSADGFIVANRNDANVRAIVSHARVPVHWYFEGQYPWIKPPFEGKLWRENMSAVITLGNALGVPLELMRKAMRTFRGIVRRQEVRYKGRHVFVIDDNAHSPEKVEGALEAIRAQHPGRKIIAVYEPGSRTDAALRQRLYRTCFRYADCIILPRVSSASGDIQLFNERLSKKISRFYPSLAYVPDDTLAVGLIQKIAARWRQKNKKAAVVFMSQKGFRGMIEELIKNIKHITYNMEHKTRITPID